VPHIPHELGLPVQAGSPPPPPLDEAKVENFFVSDFEPQCGHGVPSHRVERTSTSLSFSQSPQ